MIFAVPPAALAEIVRDLPFALPSLSSVRKLKSGVTAALDLHFFKRLPGIPSEHCILRGSDLGLTLVDNSQLWDVDDRKRVPDRPTRLSVAVTDFYKIDGMGKPEATKAILEDLRRYIDFDDEDVDFTRTYLQMNDLDPLFVNEVGSEPWRPGTFTECPGVFLAGDFCDNDIGIVSVEGAVTSGLLAARAVQACLRIDAAARGKPLPESDSRLQPIEVLLPERYPRANAEVFKAMLFPEVAAAVARARTESLAENPHRAAMPSEVQRQAEKAAVIPGAIATDLTRGVSEWANWAASLHSRYR